MSLNYAASLSKYADKGVLGLNENFDEIEKLKEKCKILAEWLRESKRVVVLTGAGISTASGIPDFRGPNGVWTLEAKGKAPSSSVDFIEAKPTATHYAIKDLTRAPLAEHQHVFVISQNVDNLHLRSGLLKDNLAELHGNAFLERCGACGREYLRATPVTTIGLKKTGNLCRGVKDTGRRCRGKLVDTILDWEDSLPWDELEEADYQCATADLCLVVGTSLQIQPAGNMPFKTKRNDGKVVVVNLQKTRMDTHANLVIHAKCDTVFELVLGHLDRKIDASEVLQLPDNDELFLVKDAFRPPPPKIQSKPRVKRVKVHEDGIVSKADEPSNDPDCKVETE